MKVKRLTPFLLTSSTLLTKIPQGLSLSTCGISINRIDDVRRNKVKYFTFVSIWNPT